MKKYLSIYTLLALACIVLQSCLFSEEEIFDESSANRATADVIKCQEILKDVPNGWKLEYYIGSNYSAGAVTLLMKFDGKLQTGNYNNLPLSSKIGTKHNAHFRFVQPTDPYVFRSFRPEHEPRRGLRVYYNERNSRQGNSARKKIQKHNGDDAYAQRYTMAYSD